MDLIAWATLHERDVYTFRGHRLYAYFVMKFKKDFPRQRMKPRLALALAIDPICLSTV